MTQQINSYSDLVASLPWTHPAAPVIPSPQPDSYVNINPAGYVVDPLDPTKYLLYVGEFQFAHVNEDNDALVNAGKMTLFQGVMGDASPPILVKDVITPEMFGGPITYGSILVRGTTVYIYFNAGVVGDIYVAVSTDGGRNFTINFTPLLTANTGAGEGGFEIPFATDYGDVNGPIYMYYTVRQFFPDYAFIGQDVAILGSPTGPCTRQHIDVIPAGTGGAFAAKVEGAAYYKFGSDYVALFSAMDNSSVFHIGIAHSTGPLSVFTADSNINPVFDGSGMNEDEEEYWDGFGAVCPILGLADGHPPLFLYAGFKSDLWTTNTFSVGMVTINLAISINPINLTPTTFTATITDPAGPADSYKLYRNGTFVVSGTSSPIHVTGLTPGDSATWTVTRVMGGVESAASAGVVVTLAAEVLPLLFVSQPAVQSTTADGGVITYGTQEVSAVVYGLLAKDLGTLVVSSSVTIGTGPSANITLGTLTSTATGRTYLFGQSNLSLAAINKALTGSVELKAQLVDAFNSLSLSSTTAVKVQGQGANILNPLQADLEGSATSGYSLLSFTHQPEASSYFPNGVVISYSTQDLTQVAQLNSLLLVLTGKVDLKGTVGKTLGSLGINSFGLGLLPEPPFIWFRPRPWQHHPGNWGQQVRLWGTPGLHVPSVGTVEDKPTIFDLPAGSYKTTVATWDFLSTATPWKNLSGMPLTAKNGKVTVSSTLVNSAGMKATSLGISLRNLWPHQGPAKVQVLVGVKSLTANLGWGVSNWDGSFSSTGFVPTKTTIAAADLTSGTEVTYNLNSADARNNLDVLLDDMTFTFSTNPDSSYDVNYIYVVVSSA